MRRLFASLFMLACVTASPAFAVMEDYPSVKLQGLDKSVGRTVTFEAKVGSTIQYGTLFIKIQSCRKAPPIEKPESAAFLQIWEVPPGEEKSEWSFSGWMFASSPALSAMDHPVYDVWVLDCLGREEPNEEAAAAETDKEADQTDLPAADAAQEDAAQPVEALPTDSEAEPEDTEVPAAQEQDAVAPISEPQESIPTDSEGEVAPDFDANQTDPNAPQNLVPNPDAPYSPGTYPDAQQPQAEPAVRPQDPTGTPDTAYDLMNQGGTGAPPPAVEQPYDPDAPFNPNARY